MNFSDDEGWLQARETGAELPVLDPARIAQYQRLDTMLATLPPLDPPLGWEARLLAKLPPDRQVRPWGPALAAGLVALVGAGAYLASHRPHATTDLPPTRSALSLSVVAGAVTNRGGAPAVGDTLEVKFVLTEPGELRVYREDGPLVVRCPGGQGCTAEASLISVKVPIAAAGTYRAVAMTGAVPPPTGRGLSADLRAADAAGARLLSVPAVDIR